MININKGETQPDWQYANWWMESVGNHIKVSTSDHQLTKAGNHKLKIWMIDSGIVIQNIVIDAGGLKESYLSPPESMYIKANEN